jgi:hypothetical protein
VLYANDFRLVFWLAIIPGIISVSILVLGVREPAQPRVEEAPIRLRLVDFGRLGRVYWGVVAVGAVLTLARFSEAVLILRAQGIGLPIALAPLVLIVMNIVYSASAYPIGILSDRMDRHALIGIGFGVLILSDLVLAFAPTLWVVMFGIGLWGLHMGMTQGLLLWEVVGPSATFFASAGFTAIGLVGTFAVVRGGGAR